MSVVEDKFVKRLPVSARLNLNCTDFVETPRFVDYFVDASNSTHANYSNDVQIISGENAELKQIKRNYLVTFVIVALFSVLINLRVLYVVTLGTNRKIRPVSILVAHMSSVAICFTFVLSFYILEKSHVISLTAPGICELLSFLRNGVYCVFPLNAVGIIYERIRTFQITLGRLLVLRTICLIWIVAIFGNLPSIFTAHYEKDPVTNEEKCNQINLFGMPEATFAYEGFRFMLYHCLVCAYMAFALFKIRSKIRYLYIRKIPNEKMRRKVQRVRFVYLHSLIFILVWLPTGLVLFVYKLLSRKLSPTTSNSFKNYLFPLTILNFSLFIFSPLVYVFLHEDISKINFLGISSCSRNNVKENKEASGESANAQITGIIERRDEPSKGNSTKKQENSAIKKHNITNKYDKLNNTLNTMKLTELLETTDMMSRISTVAVSSIADVSSHSIPHLSQEFGIINVPSSSNPRPLQFGNFFREMTREQIELQSAANKEVDNKHMETFV